MALDHYIPQCLTRPWHDAAIGQESLRFFDFETGEFGHRNSGKLFARRGINAAVTEAYLGRYIEDPIATMQDRIVAAGTDMAKMQTAFDSTPHTALVGLYWLQVQRLKDAKKDRADHHLDEFAKKGFEWLQGLSYVVFEKYEPMLYVVRSALYFPDSGVFFVPLVDQMPAMALPIHTHLALVFSDKTTNRASLDNWMTADQMPTFSSIGLNSKRLVLPPELPNPKPESLINFRAKLREMFHLVSEAGIVAGMPVWKLDSP